jgi:hypothetical protein
MVQIRSLNKGTGGGIHVDVHGVSRANTFLFSTFGMPTKEN